MSEYPPVEDYELIERVAKALFTGIAWGGSVKDWDRLPERLDGWDAAFYRDKRFFRCVAVDAIRGYEGWEPVDHEGDLEEF